jgi:hypothetical protein
MSYKTWNFQIRKHFSQSYLLYFLFHTNTSKILPEWVSKIWIVKNGSKKTDLVYLIGTEKQTRYS